MRMLIDFWEPYDSGMTVMRRSLKRSYLHIHTIECIEFENALISVKVKVRLG